MFKRDWQLQKLGITEWILKKPAVFLGKIIIPVPKHIRLLIITKKYISLNNFIVSDVLRTLHLTPNQVMQIKPNQLAMLTDDHGQYNSWHLGVIERNKLNGVHITSVELDELIINPSAKRDLWYQICKNKCNLFSHKE